MEMFIYQFFLGLTVLTVTLVIVTANSLFPAGEKVYEYKGPNMGTASVVQWSAFLATDTEVPSSIPGATRFSV